MKRYPLDDYIIRNNMKQKQLALHFGISEAHLSLIRRGLRRPSPDLARKIESETGIPFKELLPMKGEIAKGGRKTSIIRKRKTA
jgi:transcriptional regulator with XRE-family HTH domain